MPRTNVTQEQIYSTLWKLIEMYRTSGGSLEHHARQQLLDMFICKIIGEYCVGDSNTTERGEFLH